MPEGQHLAFNTGHYTRSSNLDHVQTKYRLATQAYSQANFARANQLCDQLLTGMKTNTDLLNLKAMSCLAMGHIDIAESAIGRALKINPRLPGLHLNAALVYQAESRFKQVKRHALEAVQLAPREASVLYQAALLCRNCGDHARALRILARCLQIRVDFVEAWQLEGSIHTDLGDFEAAQKSFEMAVSLQPLNARALSTLVGIRGNDLSDKDVVAMLENIRRKADTAPDRATAAFTLADMYRRDAQYDNAFKLYREANELVAKSKPFDLDNWQKNVRNTTTETDSFKLSTGSSGEKLVFIIGMPRSGTTLCEQVLSAHADILACGELASMQQIETGLQRRGINPYGAYSEEPGLSQVLHKAGDQYLSSLPGDHHRYQRVIDKAPMNFERIGLIHKIFPAARFMYCKRHPLDTILSCYFQDFHAGLNYASDLEVITRIYIDHVRLMEHWSERMPGRIHTVDYESLVSNLDLEARAMTEFLNCDFDPAMLNPHQQQRAITTASMLQVRQPVYTTSVNRWKNYRPQLDGVIKLLQEQGVL